MPLSVSTKCPSCGGAIEFEEGSSAVHCPFCGSNHVVTGHGRVLSYYIPDKIPIQKAVAIALMKLKEAGEVGRKVREVTLFFVPFHRFVGQTLTWEVFEEAVRGGEAPVQRTVEVHITMFGPDDVLDILSGGPGSSATALTEKRFELTGGYVDRTMSAIDNPALGVVSLGIRPEVLKLSLFEKEAVTVRGQIAPVRSDMAEMERIGYRPERGREIAARCVFGKTMSVIYYPFWMVETAGADGGDGALAVVDAVSGETPTSKADLSLIDSLVDKDGHGSEVVGLRPLKCPNCDADLPVKPKDLVFFCGSCAKAWYILGEEFKEIPYTAVAARTKGAGPAEGAGPTELFPFWVVKARMRAGDKVIETKYDLTKMSPGISIPKEEDRAIPLRFFVPAFRIGNLTALSRLASSFTRNQPVFEQSGPAGLDIRGCSLTPEDALELAPLILFSIIPKGNKQALRFALDAKVEVLGGELVLLPFFKGRFEYTDGLFGWSFPTAALRD